MPALLIFAVAALLVVGAFRERLKALEEADKYGGTDPNSTNSSGE